MPIVHISGKLVHFCHVPRCGGSAVEGYLRARFGPVGFLDGQYLKQDEAARWNKCSPQHIERDALDRLLPAAFFAARFALIRNPVDRIVSVFRFQRDIENRLAGDAAFDLWVDSLPEMLAADPHALDNHPRPMNQLVPDDATVFRLEDGLDPVVDWLDAVEGVQRGPRQIAVQNSYEQRMIRANRDPRDEIALAPETLKKIEEIYAEDYERFGYDLS